MSMFAFFQIMIEISKKENHKHIEFFAILSVIQAFMNAHDSGTKIILPKMIKLILREFDLDGTLFRNFIHLKLLNP